ncbi:hypothetical protein HK22_08980 [Gluconobacter sp. DsW_056]|nr:hypothetical protein HK22_08980 [Gluconobacter sp. DsW_056]
MVLDPGCIGLFLSSPDVKPTLDCHTLMLLLSKSEVAHVMDDIGQFKPCSIAFYSGDAQAG